jgi:regulation of enolase protein 1 (concanavalin A-like superfamily)
MKSTLILLCALWAGPLRAGYLHTSGVTTVDISNEPIVLNGVDLGCWLWPEYYMMGNLSLPAYANAGTGSGNINNYYDGLVAALKDVLGGDTNLTAQVLDAYWTNFISAADIVYLHNQGFNSVRVPYTFEEFFQVTNWANNYPSNGFDISTGFKYLDNLVGWCSTNSIYVIPDMHCAPGGPNNWAVVNYGGTLNTNTASVFTNAANLALAEHVWTRIASHYATNQWIGGYDLLNEPVNTDASDNQVGPPYVSNTYSNLIHAIRLVDTNHVLFCEGDAYASTLYDVNEGWTDGNWSFSDHDYGSTLPLGTGNRATAVGDNVPDWGGEFGINSTHWYNRILATTYENPVRLSSGGKTATIEEGHCFWAYKSCQEYYTIAQNPQTAGWNTLKTYWASDNTLPAPSVTNAYNWLIGFALAANFSNCLVHPEIVDSLMRLATNFSVGFSQSGLPYKNGVTIPGKIFAVDYDMGDTNVTYSNTVSDDEANDGPGGTAWNNGYFGRDDGVDETSCNDPGTLLKVGWNVAGEWERHTVTSTPGTYDLYVRYAGGAEGGQLSVMLDSNTVSGIVSLGYTGSYTVYTNFVVRNVTVTNAGQTTLQINVVVAGYDLAWIEFVPASGPPLPPTGEKVVGAGPGIPAGLTAGIEDAAGNMEASLNWVASEGAISYNLKRAVNSGGPYATVASCVALSYVDTGLSNGTTYYYVVSALNGNGEGANSSEVNATPQPTTLPTPWMDQDVGVATEWDGDSGDVGWPGSASFASGVYTVTGSGIDIWNAADSFHYVYRAVSGDCTIISRVSSLQVTDPWAKGGVMIRESFNQDSANVMMLISAQNGSLLSDRPATGAPSSSLGGAGSAPYWVKLVRAGNVFAGSISSNGATWQPVGSVTVPMATNVLLGLAVTAHNNTTMNTATFDNVSVTLVVPSAPTGLTASSNTAQVSLTWTASTGATSYNIKRSSANGGPYTAVAAVLASINYIDTAVVNGATYYYVVTSANANGESLPSNQAAVSVPLPALAAVYAAANNSLTLSWPLPASPFTLFSTPSLASPVVWSPVTNALVNQSGTISATWPGVHSNAAQFFRLAAP